MPVPTSYTEETLSQFMFDILGATGVALSLDPEVNFAEAVIQTLVDYGISEIDAATDIFKIRAIARVHAWEVALATVASDYNFADGGARFDRGQMHDHIIKMRDAALFAAIPYLSDYQVRAEGISHTQDPYVFQEI